MAYSIKAQRRTKYLSKLANLCSTMSLKVTMLRCSCTGKQAQAKLILWGLSKPSRDKIKGLFHFH